MSKSFVRLTSLGAATLLLGACVARSDYDRLVQEYHSENQARVQLETQLNRRDGEEAGLRSQLNLSESALAEANENQRLSASRIAELEGVLQDAENATTIEGVDVFMTAGGFAYRIGNDLLFDSGSTKVKKRGRQALQEIAQQIISKGYETVRIDGHTDTDPIVKTKEIFPLGNHQLAAARALAVFDVLTNDAGVSTSVFTLASFGPNQPAQAGSTNAAKAKNRRVEIHIKVPEGG